MCIRDRCCTDPLKVIRQGSRLSPLLFKLYVEYIMKDFMETSNNGIIINDVCYKTIRSTDEVMLLGNNEEEVQYAVHQMN